jgi:hypothetical protein
MKEKDLYEPIRLWLENDTVNAMGGKRPKTFGFFDVHSQYLNRYLIQKNLTQCLGAESFGWRIKVDLFGYVQKENSEVKKYIVEVKDKQASLMDLSQLIGYSSICNPDRAFLISSGGFSQDLHDLIYKYGRKDLLRMSGDSKHRRVTKIEMLFWDINTGLPDRLKSFHV